MATRRLVSSVGVIITESGGFLYFNRFDFKIVAPVFSHLLMMRAIPPLNSFIALAENPCSSNLSIVVCRLAFDRRQVLVVSDLR